MPAAEFHDRSPEEIALAIQAGTYGDLQKVFEFALSLKARADQAERDFILFLRALELSKIWEQSDSGTYVSYLKMNRICSPERYQSGVRVLELIPSAMAMQISFAASKEVARISEPGRRAEGMQKALEWVKVNGAPPSAQTTRTLLGLHPVRQANPRIQALEAENSQLRGEIDRLKGLVVALGGDPNPHGSSAKPKSEAQPSVS